jgi:hypothetical protein
MLNTHESNSGHQLESMVFHIGKDAVPALRR